MTGQQKEERIGTLQDHLILNKKEKKKGSLIQKTGFKNHQREQKSSRRIISTRKPHLWTEKKIVKANK